MTSSCRAAGSIALRAAAATLTLPLRSSALIPTPVSVSGAHRFASALRSRSTTTASTAAAAAAATTAASAMTTTTPPATNAGAKALPQRPLRYLSGGDAGRKFRPLDLSDLDDAVSASEGRREEAFALSRKISMCLSRRRFRLERGEEGGGESAGDEELEGLMARVLGSGGGEVAEGAEGGPKEEGGAAHGAGGNRAPREANLSLRVEDYVRLLAYERFLSDGTLLPPSSVPPAVTDEEYLGGACIGLARDLERYGVGRATVRDAASVRLARELVGDVMDRLLLFDFRNGPLRRKYDGTKYALRTLETVLYELSVTGTSAEEEGGGAAADGDGEPDLKKMRVEGSSAEGDAEGEGEAMDEDKKEDDGAESPPPSEAAAEERAERVPKSQIESLRLRMERRDELRERLIKRCRDGQKAAKQAIYALHRGDLGRARKLLGQCEGCARADLLPIVEEEPGLRHGSFANVMEEYAEARLFYAWLVGKEEGYGEGEGGDGAEKATKVDKPAGVVLRPDEFPLRLEPSEYLGGLCDLTGEVGRYAVQRGTARDSDGVRLCLETNMSILHALETLNRFPSGGDIGKKMGPLRHSVQKLERMLYEMSLVEATGGKRNVAAESVHAHDGAGDDG